MGLGSASNSVQLCLFSVINHQLIFMDFQPFIEYCNKHIKGDEKGEAQQPFINLVGKIFSAKENNPQAYTNHWEKEIYTLVYPLYGLTEKNKNSGGRRLTSYKSL